MALFIKGMGNVSPQQTWDENPLFAVLNKPADNKLTAVEPDYNSLIDAKLLRRMSRIIKMGVAASSMALKQSTVPVPDSIITATGYGCLEDTGTFLTKMIENKEQALNPTPFIQSTHNTIGSQIALILQCQGYNQTYAHGAFSFESVLLDALIQADENPSQKILIGGVDEITPASHAIQKRFNIFGNEIVNGEGSAFFVVSGKPDANDIAKIERLATFYKPEKQDLISGVKKFLDQSSDTFDLILAGSAADSTFTHELFPNIPVKGFKQLCGEYPVATAFATWLAAKIMKDPNIASRLSVAPVNTPTPQRLSTFQNILIFNSYFGTHYSLIHIKAC